MNKTQHIRRKGAHHNKAKWLKQIQEKEQKRAKRTHVSMKIEYYSEDL